MDDLIPGTSLPRSLLSADKYWRLSQLTRLVARGGSTSLLCIGSPGAAKSSVIRDVLRSEGLREGDGIRRSKAGNEFHVVSGHTSGGLGLYSLLFALNGDNVLVFDDLAGWDTPTAIALLKACLDDKPERKVSYRSSALPKSDGDLPMSFTLRSRIIFVGNKTQDAAKNPDLAALMSRVHSVTLYLSLAEKLDFIEKVLLQEDRHGSTLEDRKAVLSHVRHAAITAPDQLDYRAFWKLVALYAAFGKESFDMHIREMLPPSDPELALMIEANRRHKKAELAMAWWCARTGLSRKTYYERRKGWQKILREVLG